MKHKTLFIFGTRPEAVKMAPLILLLKRDPAFRVKVAVTAQHRQMLDAVLSFFGIRPDYDLDLMRTRQDPGDVAARCIAGLGPVLAREKPGLVLVQGDTTTAFSGALAAFYRRIPVGHLEAGLRTARKYAPFPEEINRRMISSLADIHFAPSRSARENLMDESVPSSAIRVTGNTGLDALRIVREKLERDPSLSRRVLDRLASILSGAALERIRGTGRMVLVTAHRRETFGREFGNICRAVRLAAERHRDFDFVFPVHRNPEARDPVFSGLKGIVNVHLTEPLEYPEFVCLMTSSHHILTDSGGIQEEAPALGKPVLVMRDVTERPEAVRSGSVKLVGTGSRSIRESIDRLIRDAAVYRRMSVPRSPYGDGHAAARIRDILKRSVPPS